MAADLAIHVFKEGELTEQDFRDFFSNSLGSKWCNLVTNPQSDEVYDKFSKTDHVFVGEVSWLKASLLEDSETYIPDPIGAVSDIIGEDWPIVDDELIARIDEAMQKPNTTGYEVHSADDVVAFLRQHKGKRAFTVSW